MDNAGIEPAASSTLRRHSTTELIAHRVLGKYKLGTRIVVNVDADIYRYMRKVWMWEVMRVRENIRVRE